LSDLIFSDDGSHLLAGFVVGSKRVIWDLSGESAIAKPNGQIPEFSKRLQSSDGRLALIVGSENTPTVINIATKQIERKLGRRDEQISAMALSGDGKRAFVGYRDCVNEIWNTDTGKLVRNLAYSRITLSASLSHDGKLVATINDATVNAWNVLSGQQLFSFYSFGNGKDWLAHTPDGYFDGSQFGREIICLRLGESLSCLPRDQVRKFRRVGLMNTSLKFK
jgi:WD40 repeat protein